MPPTGREILRWGRDMKVQAFMKVSNRPAYRPILRVDCLDPRGLLGRFGFCCRAY